MILKYESFRICNLLSVDFHRVIPILVYSVSEMCHILLINFVDDFNIREMIRHKILPTDVHKTRYYCDLLNELIRNAVRQMIDTAIEVESSKSMLLQHAQR